MNKDFVYEEQKQLIKMWKTKYYEQKEEIERLTKQNKALNEMYELTKKGYIRLNNIIKEVKDYIRSKSIKFTMAYVEDDGRIDLSRSEYRIDKLTSKQVKELLGILEGGKK